MTHLTTVPPALLGRRLLVIEHESLRERSYAAAFRDAGAIVTVVGEVPVDLRESSPDALILLATGSDRGEMKTLRTLRDAGFDGLMLAVVPTVSPDSAMRWVFLGGVDDFLPEPIAPRELVNRIADHLIRSRNAMLGRLSAFAPGIDDFPVPELAEAAAVGAC